MAGRELLNSQWASLRNAIEAAGLAWTDFERRSEINEDPVITHKGSGYTYIFSTDRAQRFVGHAKPGRQRPSESVQAASWGKQLGHFEQWLASLKRELASEDPWSTLAIGTDSVGGAGPADDTPFAAHEVEQIEVTFADLRGEVRQLSPALSESQLLAIDSKLDELLELARDPKQPRGHWRTVFIGSFVWYMIEAILPPSVTGSIVTFGLRGLAKRFWS